MFKNKYLLTALLLIIASVTSNAQQGFTDNFSDGNFTANPTWVGETFKFQIDVNDQLQLNDGTANSPAYLVTASTVINDASWEFYVEMDFPPSGQNYGEVYLVSSQQDLTQSLDGYFVRIGGISGSADDVSLYRKDGNTEVEIIDGIDGIVGQDPVKVKVRVTKDLNGQWELFADTSAALNNMLSQGTTTDVTHIRSSYFGVLCTYTSGRSDKFFFDDFVVNGQAFQDTVKPEVDTFMVRGNDQIEIHFSELVDVATASNLANYDLDPTLGNPSSVVIDVNDSSQLTLDYPSGFISGTNYELEVVNIEDRNGNLIDTDTLDFFYFDPAPLVDSVVVQGNNQLEVYFSELVEVQSATNTTNFTADNSLGNPNTATIDATDSSLVILDFTTTFASGTNYELEVKNIADRNGNIMTTDTVSFFYFVPATAAYRDVVINEFYPDPNPSNGLPSGEFVEIYNASNKVFDLQNWEISDATSSESLPSYTLPSDEYVIICAQSDVVAYQGFGNVIGISSLPTLNNGGDEVKLTDNNGNTIDQLEYDLSWYKDASKESGGWTLEQINPFTDCIGINNYAASTANLGGTPGIQNSVYDTLPDTIPPDISNVNVISQDSVLVTFSEYMDSTTIENGTYTFNTSAAVGQVFNQPPEYTSALLLLSTPLDSGILHTLTVSGVSDCAGNLINSNNQNDLVIPAIPNYRDVVINELFPDYSPAVGLPQAEFIELFNASDKIFDLAGWSIADPSSDADLTSHIFQPGDYIIVCAQSDAANFQAFGNTMGLSSTPSLNNSDDQISLFDLNGKLIDLVNYTSEWYQDASKDDGGWTLEQINPFTACTGKSNFIASNNNQGGTPGAQNSVFDTLPNTSSPILETADVLSADSVLLSFNERLDSVSVLNASYSFNTGVTVGSVQNIYPDYDQVLLILNSPLDSGVINTITVTNLTDCPGNQIGNQNEIDIVVPGIPDYRDVVINEFMCDPTPEVGLPDAEFIELYNASQKIFDLSGWTLGDRSTISTLENLIFRPGDYIIICSNGSEAAFSAIGPTQGQLAFPSLTNSGDEILLKSPKGELIDYVNYTDEWYQDDDKKEGGYSIEQINSNTICSGRNNYRASNATQGGTPGAQNSIFNTQPDQSAPELISATALSADTVLLFFNERLDSVSVLNASYNFNRSVLINTIINQAPEYNSVLLVLSSMLDTGVVNTITVTNLTDCPGNQIGNQNQANIVLPATPNYRDIVINEFMCDPSAVFGLPDADFIELYNSSEKTFDLTKWTISNGSAISTLENLVFKPGDYITICPKEVETEFLVYGPSMGLATFPALTATGDEIILKDSRGKLIDYLNYQENWYRDCEKRRDEGYSLEQINPNLICSGSYNYIGSQANSGSTPGQENSVYTTQNDLRPPKLNRVLVHSEDTIELRFDEGIDTTMLNLSNFSFSDANGVSEIILNPLDASRFLLVLNTPPASGELVILSLSNFSDCSGNMVDKPISTDFGLAAKAEAFDIVVNEILFNPKTDGSDFVELYNRSQKIISLEGWLLANWDDRIDNREEFISESYLLYPQEYLGITNNLDNVICDYPNTMASRFIEVDKIPTYSNEEGGVYLLNSTNELIDGFRYDEDQHFELLNDVDGVSLERIDPDRASDDPDNFHSAAEKVGFATPGYENSQYFVNTRFSGKVNIDPETISPDNDGYQDVVNINYEFEAPGYVANVDIYDRSGRLIKSLVDNELLGSRGSFSWDGITDDNTKARVGIYIVFFEAFNPSGDKQIFKKTLVVAAYLD